MREDELRLNTTPNVLTGIRIALVPVLVFLLSKDQPKWDLIAAIIFVIASITDAVDGYIARKQKLVTVYGKLMDPLADKFLVVSALIMLLDLGRIHPILVILLICRELAITGLRALAGAQRVVISASDSGKWKTVSQMVAIPLLILNREVLGLHLYDIGTGLIYFSLFLSLWSGLSYVAAFFKSLRNKMRKRREARKKARENRKRLSKEKRRARRKNRF